MIRSKCVQHAVKTVLLPQSPYSDALCSSWMRVTGKFPSFCGWWDPTIKGVHFTSSPSKNAEDGQKKSMINRLHKTDKSNVTDEMKAAAENVAKRLPGDWTKTSEELLSRLASHKNPPVSTDESATSRDSEPVSLLSTMQVGRSFGSIREQSIGRRNRGEFQKRDDDIYGRSVTEVSTTRSFRRTETFKDLFSVARLGVFNAERVKAQAVYQSEQEEDLWHKADRENLRKTMGSLPRNAFEEMAKWTKEGTLWTFPIDNEADMHEERKYKFYDHIFLEKHLSEFPDKGPVRKFMELVIIGLSSNPWLPVPEKIENIQWYAQYFREKQNVLEASLGEDGKMKEPSENSEISL